MHSFLNSKLLSNQQDGMTSQSFQKVMLPTSLAKDNKMGTQRIESRVLTAELSI